MNPVIGVNPNTSQRPVLTVTLESVSISVGIIIGLIAIAGGFIKIISRFNSITNDIKDIKKLVDDHVNIDGHPTLSNRVVVIQKDIYALDKKLDLHLLNYTNRTETVQFLIGQLDQKIDHKFERSQEELDKAKLETKDIEQFLQKNQSFVIRNRETL